MENIYNSANYKKKRDLNLFIGGLKKELIYFSFKFCGLGNHVTFKKPVSNVNVLPIIYLEVFAFQNFAMKGRRHRLCKRVQEAVREHPYSTDGEKQTTPFRKLPLTNAFLSTSLLGEFSLLFHNACIPHRLENT